MVIRIQTTVAHRVYRVVSPEEQLPLVVGESDSLSVHLEVHHSRRRQRRALEEFHHRLLDGLGPSQRLHVDGNQIKNVASRSLDQKLLCRTVHMIRLQVSFRQEQAARQRHRQYRVLVNQRRERTEHRLIAASLQSDPPRGRLDQEVAHQLVPAGAALRLHVRGDLRDLQGHPEGAREGVGVSDHEGARGLVAQQRDGFVPGDVGLVPELRGVPDELHVGGGYLLGRFAVGVHGASSGVAVVDGGGGRAVLGRGFGAVLVVRVGLV